MKYLHSTLEMLGAFLMAIFFMIQRWVLHFVPVDWRAKDLSKEIVLITGGGSGIGRMMAIRFAKFGCKLVLWDINDEGNQDTAKQIEATGGKAYAYQCDISKREEIYKVAEQVKRDVGAVTILVNNAGIVSGNDFLDIPDHMVQKTFEVNVLAHFWTTKAFLPSMIQNNHGHIVTVASLAGYVGSNRLVDYCSSKFAAVGFDESLRSELLSKGLDGVHTTCICPFYINTGMFDGVKSKVIPILEPEYVAKRIVNAVRVNDEVLILPQSLGLILVLKMMLPSYGLRPIDRAFGGSESMASFMGRSKTVLVQSETVTSEKNGYSQ